MTEVNEAIKALAKRSQEAIMASEAMHFAQAALNLAHVAACVHSIERAQLSDYGSGAQNAQQQ